MHLRGGGWRTIIRVLYRGFCHTKILNFTAPSYRFHFTIYWLTLISHVHLVIYRFQWKQYTKILTLWISIQNTDSEHQNTCTSFFSDMQNNNFWGYRALIMCLVASVCPSMSVFVLSQLNRLILILCFPSNSSLSRYIKAEKQKLGYISLDRFPKIPIMRACWKCSRVRLDRSLKDKHKHKIFLYSGWISLTFCDGFFISRLADLKKETY